MNKAKRRRMIKSWKWTRSTLRIVSVIVGITLFWVGLYTIGTSNSGGGIMAAFIMFVGVGVIAEVIVCEWRDREAEREAERARRECRRRH